MSDLEAKKLGLTTAKIAVVTALLGLLMAIIKLFTPLFATSSSASVPAQASEPMSKSAAYSTITRLYTRERCFPPRGTCNVPSEDSPWKINEHAQKLRQSGAHEQAECFAQHALCNALYKRAESRDDGVIAAALYELGYAMVNQQRPGYEPLLESSAQLRYLNGQSRHLQSVCELLKRAGTLRGQDICR